MEFDPVLHAKKIEALRKWVADHKRFWLDSDEVTIRLLTLPALAVDLSATAPTHFYTQIVHKAYELGLEKGREEAKDNIRKALGL